MKFFSLILVATIAFTMACSSSVQRQKSSFTVVESEQGIELSENGRPVFAYQKKPKTLTGQYICNNYIHPLYNLNGDILTEEFPPDHSYHRGIFWAWHQLYEGNRRLGDGWTNDSISQEVVKITTDAGDDIASLKLNVLWNSKVSSDGKPFIDERTTITVHKLESGIRKIDFEITLKALVKGLQIGGSADQKGYGGFCVRMRLPDSLVFTSDNGPVTPRELQIEAGPWMDFSGKFGSGEGSSGIAILCSQDMPDSHISWILRRKGSMQNVVYPGSEKIHIPMDKPLVLRYRLIIHDGDSESIDLSGLQQEYAKMKRN
jgi:hypothetical protein